MSGLTVAVTGPTGDIGLPLLRALEACDAVDLVVGMARSPFAPAEYGLDKVEYRQGDVLDRASVDSVVAGADVVVHLAFIIVGDPEQAQRVNVEGSTNVFEAAVAAGAKRLVYTSSVAAYGFHADNPQPLTEATPARGSDDFYYSRHKAELEAVFESVVGPSATEGYMFRPCIVAGPDATTLIETVVGSLPLYGQMPLLRRAVGEIPLLAPIVPDPGVPIQLVHHDDVATALVGAIEGRGEPGAYNLAAADSITMSDMARELGLRPVSIPRSALDPVDAILSRVPGLPVEIDWLTAFMNPVLMDCSLARRELDWEPLRTTRRTLVEAVASARERRLI